jgi:hypothetical protein
MRRISGKYNSPHPETGRTPLLELIRRYIGDAIVSGLRVPRKNLCVALWLARDVFFSAEAGDIAVCHTVQTVLCDSSGHVVIRGMDDKV